MLALNVPEKGEEASEPTLLTTSLQLVVFGDLPSITAVMDGPAGTYGTCQLVTVRQLGKVDGAHRKAKGSNCQHDAFRLLAPQGIFLHVLFQNRGSLWLSGVPEVL